MKKSLPVLIIFVLVLNTCTSFAQGIYMEIAVGNGIAEPYSGEILLSSVQYGFLNTTVLGSSAGGTSSGKAQFASVTLTKQLDPSSASLQKTLFMGGYYQRIRLNFYRAGASGRELAYQVVLGMVVVNDYSVSAAEGCVNGCPALAETIKLNVGQVVTREFVKGTATRTVTWNVITNTSTVDSFLTQTN